MTTYSHNGIEYHYPTDYADRLATLIATLAQSARLRGAETEAERRPRQPQTPRPYAVEQVVSMAGDTAVRGIAMKSAPGDQTEGASK